MSNEWNQDNSSDFMGGDSLPSVSFPNLNDTAEGVVTKITRKADIRPDGTPNTWADGSAKHVFIFELDGERALWVRGNMVKAIRDAVKTAGLATPLGALLTVQHSGLGEKKPGFNQAKLYRAKCEPAPVKATATAGAAQPW